MMSRGKADEDHAMNRARERDRRAAHALRGKMDGVESQDPVYRNDDEIEKGFFRGRD
jgi:hypothetical protein